MTQGETYEVTRDDMRSRWVYTMPDGTKRVVTDEDAARFPPFVDETGTPILRGVLTEDERSAPLSKKVSLR